MESKRSRVQLTSSSSLNILVVDDDEASLSAVSAILQSLNYKVSLPNHPSSPFYSQPLPIISSISLPDLLRLEDLKSRPFLAALAVTTLAVTAFAVIALAVTALFHLSSRSTTIWNGFIHTAWCAGRFWSTEEAFFDSGYGILRPRVVAVRNANEALYTLRVSRGSFHLVLTELHLPDTSGFELLKIIHQEFHLPVVFMSVVGDENTIIKGLESGAAFFLVKPVSPENIKILWQIAVANREMSPSFDAFVEVGEIAENQPAEIDFEAAKLNDFGQEMGGAGETSASGSKPRMVWTNELNNKFLEAIKTLGHKASPEDITEFMGVPGLSRRLVASHLQDFLRSERDIINRDLSILASGGLLGLQYLTPSIRQYQEASARISAAFNLNPGGGSFSPPRFVNYIEQAEASLRSCLPTPQTPMGLPNNIGHTNQGGGSFSPPRYVNLIKQASLPSLLPSPPPIPVPQSGLLLLHQSEKSDNFSSNFLDNDVELNDVLQQQQNAEQFVNPPFSGYGSNDGGEDCYQP